MAHSRRSARHRDGESKNPHPQATRDVLEPLNGYLILAEKLLPKAALRQRLTLVPLKKISLWVVEHLTQSWGKGARWHLHSANIPTRLLP